LSAPARAAMASLRISMTTRQQAPTS
jgi:hypothetical protein